jgi:lipopolysaccharide export LptBFGC system permease protein LptF
MHRRLATPWACLIVTFFAVPAGTRTARHSTLSGIFMALAAFVLYYMLLGIGSWLGMRGIVWPWLGAWLSNITFVVSGTIMTIRLR